MKIILDTNVLIDATNDDFSHTWKIIDLIVRGDCQAYASEKILREYNLIIKRNIKRSEDKTKLEDFIARVEVVRVHKRIKIIKDDPEDDKFIECADEVKADYIISSDRHLLNLENYKETRILMPKDFWYLYQNKKPDADDEWKDVFKNMLGV